MAAEYEVCYVIVDGQTVHTITIPKNCTVERFFEYLENLTKVNNVSRIYLFDYKGDLIYPSQLKLPINTPDTAYCVQVLPESAFNNNNHLLALSDDVKMDLVTMENRINQIEALICNDCSVNPDYMSDLKQDFQNFRDKLENGAFVRRIKPSSEVPLAHRKLKYRRLSDDRQKEVRERFTKICNNTLSEEVLQCLRLPSFDCSEWSDEEILLLMQHMYLHFDFPAKYNICMTTLRNFLFQVYKNYNEVPFHNFRHSFCVTQMMYAMILQVDLIKLIGDLEILVLITSCICHDLDHPGYNNIYQINARTELALRYNDISPLENHHCCMAFRILDLPDCNIFENFSPELFRTVREGIIRCILATDMARHNEILDQFREAIDDGYEFSNKVHVNLLCMTLIKVADISNEARPMNVAEPWLDKLFKEFFTQSDAEKKEGLPVTPFMDRDKVTKPSSQCSFIGYVLLPLFEQLGRLFPELEEMIVHPVRYALEYYRKLNEAVKDEQRQQRKSVVTLEPLNSSTIASPNSPSGCAHGDSSISAVLEAKMTQQRSEDTSTLSEDGGHSLEYLTEEEEEATKTEVAVSEKAFKFKISTESTGVRSHPGSRKGSREKATDYDVARAYRLERSNRTSESGADKRSWSSSENTSSYDERRSDNSHDKRYQPSFSPTTAIPEGSTELQNTLLNDKLKKLNRQQQETSEQPKPQSSSTRSPDLKRLMNRVVRDFRGGKNKVANGMKSSEESSTKNENKSIIPPAIATASAGNSTRQQHKDTKSWMTTFLQNIRLRGNSHEAD